MLMFSRNSTDVKVELDVEDDHHELEDDQDVSSLMTKMSLLPLPDSRS